MTPEDFITFVSEKDDTDYGICPAPVDAQTGLNILIDHFLGEGWYVSMPICQEQVNTEAIYEILKKYPNVDKSFIDRLLGIFKKNKG